MNMFLKELFIYIIVVLQKKWNLIIVFYISIFKIIVEIKEELFSKYWIVEELVIKY